MHKPLQKNEIKRLMKRYKNQLEIYVILENIQYARNVASIFRIADAAKVRKLYLTGITPTPPFGKELVKVSRHKEKSVQWEYVKDTGKVIQHFKRLQIPIIALELTNLAIPIHRFSFPQRFALIVGNENYGITRKTLNKIPHAVYIPMFGRGASLNVHVSLAVALFYILLNRIT